MSQEELDKVAAEKYWQGYGNSTDRYPWWDVRDAFVKGAAHARQQLEPKLHAAIDMQNEYKQKADMRRIGRDNALTKLAAADEEIKKHIEKARLEIGRRVLAESNLYATEEKLKVAIATLEIYKHLKPQNQYVPTGTSEDEQLAYLKANPEFVPLGAGGIFAAEALAEITRALEEGNK